ncbi:carboxypeptidase KEX1 [Coccidioides immitis H538.4]|uniref:Pheromone-processing carboxypeptidase KEX1 n=1 Tax=Coccidioides immitis H538.4 TaxID=396776 RepID=A0A0J8UTH1_COCIT|nr:carboxypeptidase KEX1 [Coccidioides immitis H538.4]
MPSTSTFTRTPAFLLHTLARWLLVWGVLGSSVVAEKKCASNYYVRSLPGQPDGPLLKMHAGHVEVDHKNNGNLFFWHFQNRHIANRQRTVIWLNGGPGCSSMDGALMEIGPYRLKDDHTLIYNEGSWDEFANILFVDQPVGTGFSYVNTNSYIHELDEMASHFVTFLEKWFELFPEYEHDDLYFAGESYAGHTKSTLEPQRPAYWQRVDLPVEQYQAYLTYAYKENLIQSGTDAAKRVERAHSECISELDSGGKDRIHAGACEKVLSAVLEVTRENGKCINMYDIRLRDEFPSCGMNWPPDLKHITPYLRRDDVISALHVNDDKRTGWRECTGAVSSNFNARNSKPSVQLLPEILESGIPITLFSGAKDFICNHIGTEQFIHNMQWSGGMGFELSPGVWAPRHDWTFEGEAAGYYQEARNLTYVLFYNASHMVPFDFGRRSRDMLDRFLGVDITSIGGNPADSRIDGEKGALTSVGNHPNSTTAEQREKEKLKAATWAAYYKSGEVALVVVAIAAAVWGFFIWRSRRQRQGSGYREAAADFDASELDTLRGTDDRSPGANGHCSVGGDSEDEDEKFGAQKESYHPSNMPSSSSS